MDMAKSTKVTLEILEEIMKAQGFLVQFWHESFMVISAEDVFVHHKNPGECWMWAFVNREKKRYDLRFKTFKEFREALFEADELCYGLYPSEAIPNPWHQISDEQILLTRDIFRL